MNWYVKGRNSSGDVASVLCHTRKDVLENAAALRAAARHVWIENASGRIIDEASFK